MKTIHIDFTDSTVGTVGRAGEHNKTQLVFELTSDFKGCDFINAKFVTADGNEITLENLVPDEGSDTLRVELTQQLTVEGELEIQLIGYFVDAETDEPSRITKSPVVYGVIQKSARGTVTEADSNPSLLDRIWAKIKTFHKHNNLSVLDKLTEETLRLLEEGAMVERVEVTQDDSDTTVLRLKLLMQDQDIERVRFIDLPIFAADIKYIEGEDGSGSFGLGLDIGLNTYRPMPQVIDAAPGDNGFTEIYPNALYVFGEVDKLHIVLKSEAADHVNSFYFSFVAHDMTMFTLPNEVKWGNDNEIVVEGGKQYEVSVVNNVALWTATTVEAVSE